MTGLTRLSRLIGFTGFTGTWALTRVALRNDRVQLAVWQAALAGVTAASASSVIGLYPTERDRLGYAGTNASSAVARVFNGPVLATEIGAIVTAETLTIVSVLAALMSAFTVVRHTRRNEEAGRGELIGSAAVGRYAGLASALLVAVGANLVLAALLTAVLRANDLPFAGSLAVGAAVAAVGITFAAVAAVTAQVSQSARGASGLAAAGLGLAFVLRAAGNGWARAEPGDVTVTTAWPSRLSPIGWAEQVRPYAGEAWWMLGLCAAFAAALVVLAGVLAAHRDVGTGMLRVRRGPAGAPPSLLSPLGLAWRLQRGALLGWATGMVIMGGVLGAVGNEAEEVIGDNDRLTEAIQRLGGVAGAGDVVDAYFAAMMGIFAVVVSGYTVQALLRMRVEETGPLESVLATSVSRTRWMAGHLLCAVAGTAGILALFGLAAGAAYSVAAGTATEFPSLLGAPFAQLPAVLALAGLVVAVVGAAPRLVTAVAWAALGACLLVGQIGSILDLPQWALNLSPFSHVPALPAQEAAATPLVLLLMVAAGLTALGTVLFHRRDLRF